MSRCVHKGALAIDLQRDGHSAVPTGGGDIARSLGQRRGQQAVFIDGPQGWIDLPDVVCGEDFQIPVIVGACQAQLHRLAGGYGQAADIGAVAGDGHAAGLIQDQNIRLRRQRTGKSADRDRAAGLRRGEYGPLHLPGAGH